MELVRGADNQVVNFWGIVVAIGHKLKESTLLCKMLCPREISIHLPQRIMKIHYSQQITANCLYRLKMTRSDIASGSDQRECWFRGQGLEFREEGLGFRLNVFSLLS